MNFKLLGTGLAALTILATSFTAQAADIPRPVYKGVRPVVAYYNWTGFYVGIHGGYGWKNHDFAEVIQTRWVKGASKSKSLRAPKVALLMPSLTK